MPQPKLPAVDWVAAAWGVGNALEKLPNRPDGLLGLGGAKAGAVDSPVGADSAAAESALRTVSALVERLIRYRLDTSVKEQTRRPKGRMLRLSFLLDTNAQQIHFYEWLTKGHVPLSRDELAALQVFLKLRQVVAEGCVPSEDRWKLPLMIADIQGKSASNRASKSAANKRNVDRRSPLRKLIADERLRDSVATGYEVLHRLCDGDAAVRDVVIEYRDERLYYRNERDEITSVSIEQFQKLFAQSKPGG